MKKGFTLIELLVVVLIIGILSAIALPQYRVAVEKSRLTEAMSNIKYILQTMEIDYLENGVANSLHPSDVLELRGGKWDSTQQKTYCTDNFVYYFNGDMVLIARAKYDSSCPNLGIDIPSNADYFIVFNTPYTRAIIGEGVSFGADGSCYGQTSLGNKICTGVIASNILENTIHLIQ